MWFSPSSMRAAVSRRLTPERKLWISKLRHGEHAWQRIGRLSSGRSASSTTRSYDALRAQINSLEMVRSVLDGASVAFVELPRLNAFRPILVVNSIEAKTALTAISARLDTTQKSQQWGVRFLNAQGQEISSRRSVKRPSEVAAVRCLCHVIAPNGRELSTPAETVTVEFWEEMGANVPRPDGAVYLPGALRRRQQQHDLVIDYIEPAVWHHARTSGSVLRLPAPHLKALNEEIDIVYTWVDGSDSEWREKMRMALEANDLRTTEASAISASRFTSRDELKYSLRSLEYYASWFRHIFIVTDSQVPPWLRLDHPQLTVIDHREIFADPEVLPVFNSHAIESQLHHINGLSDRYLYLNDDCFFLRPTQPELFYTGNGLAKHFPSIVPVDIGGWSPRDLPIISAAKQGRDYLLEKYGRTVTHRFQHTPHPQLRPVLDAMEEEEPELFAQVASSQFRAPGDFSIPSSLQHFDSFARGRSVEGDIDYQFVDLARNDLALQLGRVSRRTDLDVFCLNETTVPDESARQINRLVAQFFEDRFPLPSSFELVSDETGVDFTDSTHNGGYPRGDSELNVERRRR